MQEKRGKNMFEWERIISYCQFISSIMGKKMGNYMKLPLRNGRIGILNEKTRLVEGKIIVSSR